MNLRTLIFTQNACYKAGRTITPRGIMVHSTGANNPNLRRYVGPDDGYLGNNPNGNHWNQDRPDGREVCVHGFIGKLADGSVASYQTLPWNYRGWHCGGTGNDTHISFEICEDGLTDASYLNTVYQEAVELCAYLCRMYGFNPLADGVIIGHYEGYQRGIASNHGDPQHWFSRHGKSMAGFRTAVNAAMNGSGGTTPGGNITVGSKVAFRSGTAAYYPGGPTVPSWVITDYYHRVTADTSGGNPVIKGGKTCVLLGRRISKTSGVEENGINTWVDKDVLNLV